MPIPSNVPASFLSASPISTPPATGLRLLARSCRALAVAAALLLLSVSAQAAETLRLASSYKASGTNADGSSYHADVTIKILSDTTFSIEWKLEDGSVNKGFGMRMNNAISATYMLEGQPGLIIYQIEDGGKFAGIWAIKGQPGSGTETLTPKN